MMNSMPFFWRTFVFREILSRTEECLILIYFFIFTSLSVSNNFKKKNLIIVNILKTLTRIGSLNLGFKIEFLKKQTTTEKLEREWDQ